MVFKKTRWYLTRIEINIILKILLGQLRFFAFNHLIMAPYWHHMARDLCQHFQHRWNKSMTWAQDKSALIFKGCSLNSSGLHCNLTASMSIVSFNESGARLTKAYDVTIQRYRNSHAKNEDSKMHILRCMGSKFRVKFQRCPLKFHTKFWTHAPQNMHFTRWYKFDDLWYLRDMTS